MNLEDIDLHDSIFVGMEVFPESKEVKVFLDVYFEGEKHRKRSCIIFEGVSSVSGVIDFFRLEVNLFAGNVSYWIPAVGGGVTYIYLCDGCVAVCSELVRIVVS